MAEQQPGYAWPNCTWLEEYRCGCTNVVERKADLPGYCPKHGENRANAPMQMPKDTELGLAS